MYATKGGDYPTIYQRKQEFLFHRGPGSGLFLVKAIARGLKLGIKVCINNITHTEIVEQSLAYSLKRSDLRSAELPVGLPADFHFGKYDFSATVGLWLRNGGGDGRNFLSPFISVDSFEFTPEEYLELRERIEQYLRKHKRKANVSAALEDLNTGFFRHQSLEESEQFIRKHLEEYLRRARDLKQRYLMVINGYARKSIFQRRQALRLQVQQITEIRDLHRRLPEFKGRPLRKSQQALRTSWEAYWQVWYGVEKVTVPALNDGVIQQEVEQLGQQKRELSRELAAASLALSQVTVDPALGDADELAGLARELDRLVQDIDESGVYQLPLSGGAAATASRQLQRLEAVLQRLQNTYFHLAELPDFHAYRHFWYAQPARLRRLLAPLQDLPPAAWITAFSSWYFDRCLEQHPSPEAEEFACASLVSWLEELEKAPATRDKASQPHFLQPGELPPAATALLVDFKGEGPPAGFQGVYLGQRPLTDLTARHHSLGGHVDPRLVLQQAFVPLKPPAWKSVPVTQPPPGTMGVLSVQQEAGSWQPLSTWAAQPGEELRIYLPENVTTEQGDAFREHFAAILNGSQRLTVFHHWSSAMITQALLSDGANSAFLIAALLRATEACMEIPYEPEALMAIGREVRLRCGIPDPAVHPLAEQVHQRLKERMPSYFFTLHQPWRDTFLPLVCLSPSGQKTVVLPAGRLPGAAGKYAEALRQRELAVAGFTCLEINALACWEDVEKEVDRLIERITVKAV